MAAQSQHQLIHLLPRIQQVAGLQCILVVPIIEAWALKTTELFGTIAKKEVPTPKFLIYYYLQFDNIAMQTDLPGNSHSQDTQQCDSRMSRVRCQWYIMTLSASIVPNGMTNFDCRSSSET